jgi:hypothetical protein
MTLAAKPKLVEEGEWLAHQGKLATCEVQRDGAKHVTSCRAVQTARTND